jgi:branched-chain amino acid transport system permease protein
MGAEIYILDLFAYIGIFSILAISLNFEYGFTGLPNFGLVAFFMVGAYASAVAANAGYPYPVCVVIAMVISAIIGLFASLPAIRLRGDYLAITTLAFGEIGRLVIKSESWIANGVWGISVPRAIYFSGAPLLTVSLQLALIFSILALCYFFVQIIVNSQFGRIMRGIREDEVLVSSLGKNTFKYKAQVFALGSAVSGLAGSLFAQYNTFIDPSVFFPTVTFSVLVMVMIGGPGNNLGAIVGAALIQSLSRGARIAKDYLPFLPIDPENLRIIIIGVLIILVLMYRPQGLIKEGRVKTPALKVSKGA